MTTGAAEAERDGTGNARRARNAAVMPTARIASPIASVGGSMAVDDRRSLASDTSPSASHASRTTVPTARTPSTSEGPRHRRQPQRGLVGVGDTPGELPRAARRGDRPTRPTRQGLRRTSAVRRAAGGRRGAAESTVARAAAPTHATSSNRNRSKPGSRHAEPQPGRQPRAGRRRGPPPGRTRPRGWRATTRPCQASSICRARSSSSCFGQPAVLDELHEQRSGGAVEHAVDEVGHHRLDGGRGRAGSAGTRRPARSAAASGAPSSPAPPSSS